MDRLGGYIGVDLGCSARTKTPSSAVAVLDERGRLLGTPRHFRTADELVNEIRGYDWSEVILAVDAPRSVPDHRVEDYARRSCERELRSELGERNARGKVRKPRPARAFAQRHQLVRKTPCTAYS